MLVSDKYQFIIACPTKTGTNSVRAVVEKWKRQGGDSHTLSLLTGEPVTRHRIAPPPGKQDYRRVMMIRDPIARLVSMYEYLRRKDWEWSAKEITAVEERDGREAAWVRMLEIIHDDRSAPGYFDGGLRDFHGARPYMWTDSQEEMLDYLRGRDVDGSRLPWGRSKVKTLRVEKVNRDWHRVMRTLGADDLAELLVPHRNSSPDDGRLFHNVGAYLDVDGAEELVDSIVDPRA